MTLGMIKIGPIICSYADTTSIIVGCRAILEQSKSTSQPPICEHGIPSLSVPPDRDKTLYSSMLNTFNKEVIRYYSYACGRWS